VYLVNGHRIFQLIKFIRMPMLVIENKNL